jgi:phosphoserine phosphatase
VFDLDGTLHPDTLGVSLLEALRDDGLCDGQRAHRFLNFLRELGPEELRAPAAAKHAYELYAAALAGVPAADAQRLARRVWQEKRNTIFDCMRPLIAATAAHAYQIVLISGSPEEIVREVALDLSITLYQGAVFSTHNSRYDGLVAVAPGISGQKLDILTTLLAGVPVDLPRSMAIGNAAADIEILSAVGCPIAFEPSAPLRAEATRFGWLIADRDTPASTLLNATIVRASIRRGNEGP